MWSICGRYRLSREDIDDVGQSVWLLLVENIGLLREPAALPGWLARTTQRECLRALRAAPNDKTVLGCPGGFQMPQDADAVMVEQEILPSRTPRCASGGAGRASSQCRELLSMLVSDPPCQYEDISATLGMPVGSIGPTSPLPRTATPLRAPCRHIDARPQEGPSSKAGGEPRA